MKHGSRVNTLLIELMIVIFFFMLASTIMVQIFADARQCSLRAGARTEALLEAQNIAESVFAGEPIKSILTDHGFLENDGVWQKTGNHYCLQTEAGDEVKADGTLHCSTITAWMDDELLFSIPCDCYEPEGGDWL